MFQLSAPERRTRRSMPSAFRFLPSCTNNFTETWFIKSVWRCCTMIVRLVHTSFYGVMTSAKLFKQFGFAPVVVELFSLTVFIGFFALHAYRARLALKPQRSNRPLHPRCRIYLAAAHSTGCVCISKHCYTSTHHVISCYADLFRWCVKKKYIQKNNNKRGVVFIIYILFVYT